MKVQKYQASKRFGETLKKDLKISYSRDQLSRMSCDKIEGILHRIRTFLNSRNLDAVFSHMASTCAVGYERTLSPFYNIDGFSDILLSNPDFWDTLERYKIEKELPNIPPHIQMLYIIFSTTITAHELNKIKLRQPTQDIIIIDEDDKNNNENNNKNKNNITNEKSDFKIGKKI